MSESKPVISNACFDKYHDICDGTYTDYMCTCSCHATTPQSPADQFFTHLLKGEVVIKEHQEYLPGKTLISYQVVIQPKGDK